MHNELSKVLQHQKRHTKKRAFQVGHFWPVRNLVSIVDHGRRNDLNREWHL